MTSLSASSSGFLTTTFQPNYFTVLSIRERNLSVSSSIFSLMTLGVKSSKYDWKLDTPTLHPVLRNIDLLDMNRMSPILPATNSSTLWYYKSLICFHNEVPFAVCIWLQYVQMRLGCSGIVRIALPTFPFRKVLTIWTYLIQQAEERPMISARMEVLKLRTDA